MSLILCDNHNYVYGDCVVAIQLLALYDHFVIRTEITPTAAVLELNINKTCQTPPIDTIPAGHAENLDARRDATDDLGLPPARADNSMSANNGPITRGARLNDEVLLFGPIRVPYQSSPHDIALDIRNRRLIEAINRLELEGQDLERSTESLEVESDRMEGDYRRLRNQLAR
ncbi:uncharacterized protein FIESC28_00996 [Fusarium coffeatum]|uniref:Uncharacterized protein n=1 Tax=Fusarium coffeatum TaxID=231269 RepID=A0A366SA54_9HYPO|nr:uncharacterized protein FIESC28_00996 [Fusarium coffeatum]RBR26213.1 hypothetical protein FIESC28_00996 [Fusarium coffeatum]